MKVFGITGYSGVGKTTLVEKLIPLVKARGLTVSLVKHTHHGFDVDKPGKDSYRMREAGAEEVLLANDERWALMHELRGAKEPTLEDQLSRMAQVDIVLVEGYRRAPMPKIEVWRSECAKPVRYPDDDTIIGMAVDGDAPPGCTLTIMQLARPDTIVEFILAHARVMNPLSDLRVQVS